MDEFGRRDIIAIIAAMLVLVALSAWLAVKAAVYFVPHDPSDPLAKAGGLKLDQMPRRTN
jgi:hypothetical protein